LRGACCASKPGRERIPRWAIAPGPGVVSAGRVLPSADDLPELPRGGPTRNLNLASTAGHPLRTVRLSFQGDRQVRYRASSYFVSGKSVRLLPPPGEGSPGRHTRHHPAPSSPSRSRDLLVGEGVSREGAQELHLRRSGGLLRKVSQGESARCSSRRQVRSPRGQKFRPASASARGPFPRCRSVRRALRY